MWIKNHLRGSFKHIPNSRAFSCAGWKRRPPDISLRTRRVRRRGNLLFNVKSLNSIEKEGSHETGVWMNFCLRPKACSHRGIVFNTSASALSQSTQRQGRKEKCLSGPGHGHRYNSPGKNIPVQPPHTTGARCLCKGVIWKEFFLFFCFWSGALCLTLFARPPRWWLQRTCLLRTESPLLPSARRHLKTLPNPGWRSGTSNWMG